MGALAACGGGSSSAPAPAPVVGPAVDERTAEQDARGLVVEIYDTLGTGRTDSLFSLISDKLVVFGPRRIDATTTRSDALVALGKVMDPKAKDHPKVKSGGLTLVASPGGHSAWVSDVIGFGGQQLAVTAVLSNTDDIWALTAAAVAAQPSARQVKAESARDAIVPPGGASAAKLGPGADGALDKLKRGLVDPAVWGADLEGRPDAIVVGPMAGQVARGGQAIKKLWKARAKANVRAATSGEPSGAMTADGQLVWLSVPVTRVADDEEPLPLRVFAVFERAGAAWNLIALHEALAIDEPGSGMPFKQILPPAPPAPEPPKAEPADQPEPAVAKKKKSKPKPKKNKKKRPRPAD